MLLLFHPHVASYSDVSGFNLLVFREQLFLCGVIEHLFKHVLNAIIGPSHIMRMSVFFVIGNRFLDLCAQESEVGKLRECKNTGLKIAFTARHTVKEPMPKKRYTESYNKGCVY